MPAVDWQLFPVLTKVIASTGERYYASWVKRSSIYVAVDLLEQLMASPDRCIGCMSARGPESAQYVGRESIHQCRSQVATGHLHRCALRVGSPSAMHAQPNA